MIFSGSGFVFYGGMIGGILGAYIVSRWYRIGFAVTMDMCGPALAIGQAIGRMGCQLAGDGDWGLPSTVPWAMAYPRAIVGWNSDTVLKLDEHYRLVSGYFPGVRVHPAPMYETILYLGVFTILWSMRKTPHPDGWIIYWYLVLGGSRALSGRVLADQSAGFLRVQRGAAHRICDDDYWCCRVDSHQRQGSRRERSADRRKRRVMQ